MKLYYVRWQDQEAENFNLLVVAETPQQAAQFTVDYYEIDGGRRQSMDGDPEVSAVPFGVPESVSPGPISWDDIFRGEVTVPMDSLEFQPDPDEDASIGEGE